MNALVAYHSRTGNTRRAAAAIAAEMKRHGHHAFVVPIERVSAADIDSADVVFLGTWAQGLFFFAVRPAGVDAWLPGVPPLGGKPVGLYATYRLRPAGLLRKLADAVGEIGGRVVAAEAFRPGDEARIPALVQGVVGARAA